MFGLGPWELIIIVIIVVLILGSKRLPEIGKGLGGAVREFRSIKGEMVSHNDKGEAGEKGKKEKEKSSSIEAKLTGKVLEQVPAVKQIMDVKKKVDKVKKIVE